MTFPSSALPCLKDFNDTTNIPKHTHPPSPAAVGGCSNLGLSLPDRQARGHLAHGTHDMGADGLQPVGLVRERRQANLV